MNDARDALIVALDAGPADATRLARELSGTVRWLKVGMTLFYEAGPSIVSQLRELGFEIFLDLKLHDIPHQAFGAARSLARLGASMITVHASGGADMIARAVDGAREGAAAAQIAPPAIVAVTVLTSMDAEGLARIGVARPADQQVISLASLAMSSGASGVVCSPLESRVLRHELGDAALVVTPGVRPQWAAKGDQARIATPADALGSGASHLVVGRPVTEDPDPAAAARRILEEMKG